LEFALDLAGAATSPGAGIGVFSCGDGCQSITLAIAAIPAPIPYVKKLRKRRNVKGFVYLIA
jgi:hypothetical protein